MMPTRDYPFGDLYGNTENESEKPGMTWDSVINTLVLEAMAILAVVVVYELWVVVKKWL